MQLGIDCVTEDRELQEKFQGLALSMEQFLGATPGIVSEKPSPYRAKGRAAVVAVGA